MTGFKFIHNYHRNHQMDDTGGRFCIAYALSDDHRTCALSWSVCHPEDAYNKDIGRKLAKENFKPGNPKYYETTFTSLYYMANALNEVKYNPKYNVTMVDRYFLHNTFFLTNLKISDEELSNFKLTMIKKQTFNKILTALVYMQDPVLVKKFSTVTYGRCCCD